MLTILSILLFELPLALSDPICQDPPPRPSLVPDVNECKLLVRAMFDIAEGERDAPIVWTDDPSVEERHRLLPKSFTFPMLLNNCEFVVSTLQPGEDDFFSTRLVAGGAGRIVANCLDRERSGSGTIGAEIVGPRGIIAVAMRKRLVNGEGASGGLDLLNVTNVTSVRLSRPGGSSGLPSSLVEDG